MREKTIRVYPYTELPENAKERAARWLIQQNDFEVEWESLQDDAKTIGLTLTAWDYQRYMKGTFTESAVDCAHKILKEYGKTCETYKTASVFLKEATQYDDADDETSVEYEKWQAVQAEFLASLLKDYRIMADREYEYMQSEEYIHETMQANAYEFTIDGKPWRDHEPPLPESETDQSRLPCPRQAGVPGSVGSAG